MDEIIKGIYTKDQEVSFGVQMPIEIKEDESSYVDLINQINNELLDELSVKEKMIVANDSIGKIAVVVNDSYKYISKSEDDVIIEDTPLFEYYTKLIEVFESYKDEIIACNETIADKEQIIYEQQEIINNN